MKTLGTLMISNHISFAYDAPVSSCLSSDQIQIHTERYSSSEIFFFFFFLPVIESRWERNSLYWLYVYSIHWRSVVKSGGKTQRLFLLLPLLPGKLYFCKRLKGNGKRTEKRTAVPGHHSLLAYFACSYFRFLATGISFSLRTGQQQTLRLPHLILTMTAKDVAEEQRKEESHH